MPCRSRPTRIRTQHTMHTRFPRFVAPLACVLLALALTSVPAPQAKPPAPAPLRALIVGGGPERSYNQVAIESNVRYVRHLLPLGTRVRTLFADGNPRSRTVLYSDAQGHDRYRATILPRVDGPSRLGPFQRTFQGLTKSGGAPLLLYFTGHGSPGAVSYDNNDYDLWGGGGLSVKELASALRTLPRGTPVTVVMVQCFSGAFGSLLFQGGSPQGTPINLNLCGFFASTPDREAAGCTSEVNEADYHDFTSYFFAALSGIDRVGKPAGDADYNHDGMVGMNEAYAYALIHDVSIDTPVCTSDVFLRRYVPVSTDRALFQTSYGEVRLWAQPAQRAALDALAGQLNLDGPDALSAAYAQFRQRIGHRGTEAQEEQTARVIRFVRLAKSVILARQLGQNGDPAIQARYAALVATESGSPLHPQS